MPNDPRLIDRIFEDIDNNTKRIETLQKRLEELLKIVYTQATSLGIVTRIVMVIIIFLLISSVTIIINETKKSALKDYFSSEKNISSEYKKEGE